MGCTFSDALTQLGVATPPHPGWSGSRRYWDACLPFLLPHARLIITPDLRWHGDSAGAPAGCCHVARLGSDLADLLRCAELAEAGRVVVIGASMGCAVAWRGCPPLCPAPLHTIAVRYDALRSWRSRASATALALLPALCSGRQAPTSFAPCSVASAALHFCCGEELRCRRSSGCVFSAGMRCRAVPGNSQGAGPHRKQVVRGALWPGAAGWARAGGPGASPEQSPWLGPRLTRCVHAPTGLLQASRAALTKAAGEEKL